MIIVSEMAAVIKKGVEEREEKMDPDKIYYYDVIRNIDDKKWWVVEIDKTARNRNPVPVGHGYPNKERAMNAMKKLSKIEGTE